MGSGVGSACAEAGAHGDTSHAAPDSDMRVVVVTSLVVVPV